jgi:putative transposase
MSRPLRIEVQGGWYHVISRERSEIFRDDSDRRDFLERLFNLTESHAVRVHAYCLMANHFHLQVETPRVNLKDAMQRALSGYVVRFNLRHRHAGPLFKGRYRAILASEQEWICEVNRYIHLNPVRLESLDLRKKRKAEIRCGVEEPAPEAVVRKRLELLRPTHGVRTERMRATLRPCSIAKGGGAGLFCGPDAAAAMKGLPGLHGKRHSRGHRKRRVAGAHSLWGAPGEPGMDRKDAPVAKRGRKRTARAGGNQERGDRI